MRKLGWAEQNREGGWMGGRIRLFCTLYTCNIMGLGKNKCNIEWNGDSARHINSGQK